MITTCPKCGKAYEESSREEADSPTRLCMECFIKRNNQVKAWEESVKANPPRPSWIKPCPSDTLAPHERGLGGEPERRER